MSTSMLGLATSSFLYLAISARRHSRRAIQNGPFCTGPAAVSGTGHHIQTGTSKFWDEGLTRIQIDTLKTVNHWRCVDSNHYSLLAKKVLSRLSYVPSR